MMADAGYESRKSARELKRRHGWRMHITKRPRKRALHDPSQAHHLKAR